jgi:hypothetical protein
LNLKFVQPLPATMLSGRPVSELCSASLSLKTGPSSSSTSHSSTGLPLSLGEGLLLAPAEPDGLVEGLLLALAELDALVEGLMLPAGVLAGASGVVAGSAGVLSGAVGVFSPAGVLSVAVGVGDPSAKAFGAANRASGAIAAVAAAAASARRSFMKTSEVRCAALPRHASGEASACGARVGPVIREV